MKRLLFWLALLFTATGCNRVIVLKRRYFRGYYVHFPEKNSTSPLHTVRRYPVPPQPVVVLPPESTGFFSVTHEHDTLHDVLPPGFPVALNDSLCPADPGTAQPFEIPECDTCCIIPMYVNTPLPASCDTCCVIPVYYNNFAGTTQPPCPGCTGEPVTALTPGPSALPQPVNEMYCVDVYPADSAQQQPDIAQADSLSPAQHADTLEVVTEMRQRTLHFPDIAFTPVARIGFNGFVQESVYPVQVNSLSWGFGLRMRTPLKGRTELVGDLNLRTDDFFIGNNRPKAAPLPSTVHNRERIAVNTIGSGLALRLNLREKENKPLQFIDAGGYFGWTYRTANVYIDKHFDPDSPEGRDFRSKTKIKGLPYIESYDYGVTARYGRGHFSVFALWRMSDLLVKEKGSANGDLPRLVIGVELFGL